MRKSTKPKPPGRMMPTAGGVRVAEAAAMRREGLRFTAIRRELMSKYKISKATAEDDIRRADLDIAERLKADIPSIAGRIVTVLEDELHRARDRGDTRGVVAAASEIRGWTQGDTLTVQGSDPAAAALTKALAMTPAQRRQRAKELAAALGEPDDDELFGREPDDNHEGTEP